MADCLKLKDPNWWEAKTANQKETYSKKVNIEMVGSIKKGHIVEVQEDGFFTGKNYGSHKFDIVHFPGPKELYSDLLERENIGEYKGNEIFANNHYVDDKGSILVVDTELLREKITDIKEVSIGSS